MNTPSSPPPSTTENMELDDDYYVNEVVDESTEQITDMIEELTVAPESTKVEDNPNICHNCDDWSCKDCQAGNMYADDEDDQDFYCLRHAEYISYTPTCSPTPPKN